MRTSIVENGKKLPESFEEFQQLRADTSYTRLRTQCMACSKDFTEENVHGPRAWIETQISGICDECWDIIMPPGDD